MSFTLVGKVGWSDDFIFIDSELPLATALQLIRSATVPWIVIRRHDGEYLYAFHPEELWLWPSLQAAHVSAIAGQDVPLEDVLGLHEEHQSTQTDGRSAPPPIDRSWRPAAQAPSIERYIEVGPNHTPKAVGTMVLAGPAEPTRSVHRAPPAASMPAEPPAAQAPDEFALVTAGEVLRELALPARQAADTVTPPLEDEGTSPVRHPSLDVDAPLLSGADITVTVDLLRETDPRTQGGPVNVGTLATDWTTLDLTVFLQCQALEFTGGAQSTVTIRRNAASIPATIKARVLPAPSADTVAVMATFLLGTRFCGSAVRMFDLGAVAHGAAGPAVSTGTVVVEPKAVQPDITVHISKIDKEKPGRLRWLVVTERFDGLPPKLDEEIELDHDPADEATALFKEFAVLERGKHTQRIDGFGTRLWSLAPAMFRAVYWALWDRHHRPLTIQFISEEPHTPWELMRPTRGDESEIHPPLALKHAVARWIKRWDGYMRNQLPAGRICTIAPKYASASRALKRAQIESDKLVAEFAARREDGTRAAVLKLLETAPPAEPLAILHFAGHGKFAPEVATHSSIRLEDGDLAAAEVERPEVKLGRACRTLVFFNACEAGAAGTVFGEIGGWADAFLGRQFGGFIAPLWSVDDEDAGVVAAELLDKIFKHHEPIGEALRAVREAHGGTSPTFYSYLYYGDVTARIIA